MKDGRAVIPDSDARRLKLRFFRMPTKQKLDCYFTWRSHISTEMGWLRIGALALIAQLIIGYWIYKEFPAFRYLVADEGQLIENHTAVLFLAAFFLAVG